MMNTLEEYHNETCNVACDHGGICTLAADHDSDHNAGGYCSWPKAYDDLRETLEETLAWTPPPETT